MQREAADLDARLRHQPRANSDGSGWVGVDRGLSAFLVAATSDGAEVTRVSDPPKPLVGGMRKQRRLAMSVTRKLKGSNNRRKAAAQLGRHHARVANIRRHFLHEITTGLVKIHDRLVLEDLNTAGMLRNRRLARAISDAGWAEFARMITYKQGWRSGTVVLADRWFPSSRICSRCGIRTTELTLADRIFACGCGHRLDRDRNAAVNLAAWGEQYHRDFSRLGSPKHEPRSSMSADGKALAYTPVWVKPIRMKRKPTLSYESRTSEKDGASLPHRMGSTL
ncbi:RNA-guided endonuclease InsQ/TnpB family protein [Nocardia sp. NBC_00565]|uniref:RNA-guided endonuclease InsQ/TnpB family protein n=1 Tax=Nocardia sp. NBC_00565 TaxID=2975993 RepID=UPI003FA5AE79